MSSHNLWSAHLLVFLYFILFAASFAFTIGWTGIGIDDPPNVGRQTWMQKSNHPIRLVTLILACVAELLSIVFLVNIVVVKSQHWHLWVPILFAIASGLGIANAVVERPKRGDALGITTMAVNAVALVALLYYMMMNVSGRQPSLTSGQH